MTWPIEFKEKLLIGNMASNVGIITLWSPKEEIAKYVDPLSYAVMGNFYDVHNGLEPFLRNCLANPNIQYIIVVGSDQSGSKYILTQFFEYGFQTKEDGITYVCDTNTKITNKIPHSALQLFRENVILYDLTSKIPQDQIGNFPIYGKLIKEITCMCPLNNSPYMAPTTYPKDSLIVSDFPSDGNGFIIKADYIGNAWLDILNTISYYGHKSKTSGELNVRECKNMMVVIKKENPSNPLIEPYFRFNEADIINYYNDFCTANITANTTYTYGSRLFDETNNQIQNIIQKLKNTPESKSAYATTWRTNDFNSINPPCLISIQISKNIQKNTTDLTAYIRSNDMYRGWPLNAFGLRKIQQMVASELNSDMGDLTTISHSAHIYEENISDASNTVTKYFNKTNCFFDDRGYYIISTTTDNVDENVIQMTHYSPTSSELKKYIGKTCREITDILYSASAHPIDPYHISYLAEELTKAEWSIKNNKKYIQDTLI